MQDSRRYWSKAAALPPLLLSFAFQKSCNRHIAGASYWTKMLKRDIKRSLTIALALTKARSFWLSYLFLNRVLDCSPALYKCFLPLLNSPKCLERWNISQLFLHDIPFCSRAEKLKAPTKEFYTLHLDFLWFSHLQPGYQENINVCRTDKIPHAVHQPWGESGGKLVRTCDEPNRLCINHLYP